MLREPRVLLSAEAIAARVRAMAAELDREQGGRPLVVVGVLKGSFVFLADLVRALRGPLRVEFLGTSSYGGGTESSGEVRITQDLTHPVEGQDVLLVEDIVDTGLTLDYLLEMLRARQPSRLRVAALLDKPSRRRRSVAVDYLGFTIEDVFVVGYGLDHDERWRNLPYVGVLD